MIKIDKNANIHLKNSNLNIKCHTKCQTTNSNTWTFIELRLDQTPVISLIRPRLPETTT